MCTSSFLPPHQATGSALSTIVNASATLIFSLFIGFYFGWKLALVVTLFMPLLILVGILQVQMMSGYAKGGQRAVEQGGKVRLSVIFVVTFHQQEGRKHWL